MLIIEDEESIRNIVSRVLKPEGYQVRGASNGVEGLDRFNTTLPDLVLLDVKMPQMDGWETLERLRKFSDCPVIMLTVFASSEEVVRGLELGADDYIAKPFGLEELRARVNAVMRRTSLG